MPRDRANNYREKHAALGLCIQCPNVKGSGVFCTECAERKNRRKWERRNPGKEYTPYVRPPRKIYQPKPKPDYVANFWARVDRDGPISSLRPDLGQCWIWTKGKANGYGTVNIQKWAHVGTAAHRISFFLEYGVVPDNIDHLCLNKACVRPTHLESVTRSENLRRAAVVWRSQAARIAGGTVIGG